jgi:hypothetical protein
MIPQIDLDEINYTLPENQTVALIVAHRKAQNQKVVGSFCADGRVTLLPSTPGRQSNTRKRIPRVSKRVLSPVQRRET